MCSFFADWRIAKSIQFFFWDKNNHWCSNKVKIGIWLYIIQIMMQLTQATAFFFYWKSIQWQCIQTPSNYKQLYFYFPKKNSCNFKEVSVKNVKVVQCQGSVKMCSGIWYAPTWNRKILNDGVTDWTNFEIWRCIMLLLLVSLNWDFNIFVSTSSLYCNKYCNVYHSFAHDWDICAKCTYLLLLTGGE